VGRLFYAGSGLVTTGTANCGFSKWSSGCCATGMAVQLVWKGFGATLEDATTVEGKIA
jgi:hypothetical protein